MVLEVPWVLTVVEWMTNVKVVDDKVDVLMVMAVAMVVAACRGCCCWWSCR